MKPKIGPNGSQDRSQNEVKMGLKMDPKNGLFMTPKTDTKIDSKIFHMGATWIPKWSPKCVPKWVQNASQIVVHFGTHFGPILGFILVSFWNTFWGPFWSPFCTPFEIHFAHIFMFFLLPELLGASKWAQN